MYLVLSKETAHARNRAEAAARNCRTTTYWWNMVQLDNGMVALEVEDGYAFPESDAPHVVADPFTNPTNHATVNERQQVIEQLTEAAETSGLSIPFEAFYYKNRQLILNWVLFGGTQLLEVFNTATEPWLDMRADAESPSPREYAQELLK